MGNKPGSRLYTPLNKLSTKCYKWILSGPLEVSGRQSRGSSMYMFFALCFSLVPLFSLCYAEEEVQIVCALKNTDVFVAETATFTCELSRPGVPNVQWWLDGAFLRNNSMNEISVRDGKIHTLTLKDLGSNDSGTVTFRAGSLVSSAKLVVKGTFLWKMPMANSRTAQHTSAYAFWLPLWNSSKIACCSTSNIVFASLKGHETMLSPEASTQASCSRSCEQKHQLQQIYYLGLLE